MKGLKWSLLGVAAITLGGYTQKANEGYLMLCMVFVVVLLGVIIADDKKGKKK